MIDREFLKQDEKIVKVDFYKIWTILWNMKYILFFSIVLCLAGAYFYLRYTTPLYKKSITVILNNQQSQYSDNFQLISDALGVKNEEASDNQIFILRSTKLMSNVVEKGKFNVRYFSKGRFINLEQHTDAPVEFSFEPSKDNEQARIIMDISFDHSKSVLVDSILVNNVKAKLPFKKINLGQFIDIPAGTIHLAPRGKINPEQLSGQMRIVYSDKEQTARHLAGSLEISSTAAQRKRPNALTISIKRQHPKQAEDILNMLIDEYNILSKENDSQGILSTITFLDERIDGLEKELQDVEGSFTKYRTANELLDINSQSQMAVSSDKGYKDRLNDLALQESLLNNIKTIFQKDKHELIPANIGISDGTLSSSIAQYNQQVIERNRLLAGSSENNPKVQDLSILLNTLKDNIRQSIDNLEQGYRLQRQSITSQQNLNQRELLAMPTKQLALTRMSRSQQVKEPLYILLQQKREEALLMLSSLSDHAYVVDKAFGLNIPIHPNHKEIYLLALFLALVIPLSIVTLMNILRDKIISEEDIVSRTEIPLLGVVPASAKDKKSPMQAEMVTDTGREPLTESFRMLRSKLDNLPLQKNKQGATVLQVSSSGVWEGKSFVSINMALSLSYLGKKVLLIGADLHKPTLTKYLGIDPKEKGLSSYLSGQIEDIHEVMKDLEIAPNLRIIPGGPVPLNPSELLSTPMVEATIDKLREEFDYIVIDTAPFLLVSSGFVVNKYVDCTLYVVRSGHTKLSLLKTLNNIHREGSLKSVMIVLNNVDFGKYKLYGTNNTIHSYGYGYGKGEGYGYVDGKKKKKK